MSAQDNESGARADSATSSTSAIKWGVIAILALLAVYGWHGKTSAEGELSALQGEVASLRKAVDDAAQVRKSSQDEIDRLKAAETDALRQVEEGKADVSTAMAKVSELDNKVAALGKDNDDLKAKLAAATEDAKAQLSAASDVTNKIKADLDLANKAKAEAEAASAALRGEADGLKSQLGALQKDLDAAKSAAQTPAPQAPAGTETPPAAPTTPAP
ncbi:hypothetical protein [Hyphomicrobium sp.]|uniref:hypothetical protein n=1 Tax=Hyphomicrobium sp. TaxID=82 RepID=UPI000FA5BDA2|nr:hypothetical protein [Hyphomicrobium sp.]RUP10962.1 MAG: hypothetical protein EKK38_00420 [Hyphomicrobium sp.]